MRRIQHIGFVLLLGLWVLAGCQRENPGGAQESQDVPEQIEKYPELQLLPVRQDTLRKLCIVL